MLPEKYKWLENIGTLPKLVSAGLQYLGLKEIPGKGSNPVIMDMAKGLHVEDIYTDDDIAWCALAINHLIRITGKPMLDIKGDKHNLLRAKYLLNYGIPVPIGDEKLGDILIFGREGGGHATLYIAESPSTYHCLGGNQHNMFDFTEIAKSRLIGARRFYATAPPASAKKYEMNSSGLISTNEA